MVDLTTDQRYSLLQNAVIILNDSNSTNDQKIAAIVDILTAQALI